MAPRLVDMAAEDLSPGSVVVRVRWSGINYKDALAISGLGKILKRFPLNAGIGNNPTDRSSYVRQCAN